MFGCWFSLTADVFFLSYLTENKHVTLTCSLRRQHVWAPVSSKVTEISVFCSNVTWFTEWNWAVLSPSVYLERRRTINLIYCSVAALSYKQLALKLNSWTSSALVWRGLNIHVSVWWGGASARGPSSVSQRKTKRPLKAPRGQPDCSREICSRTLENKLFQSVCLCESISSLCWHLHLSAR